MSTAPGVPDPEIREAGNLPLMGRAEMLATLAQLPALAASGRMLPAGYTRQGVVRSLPKPDGRRVDKTLYSLLAGE